MSAATVVSVETSTLVPLALGCFGLETVTWSLVRRNWPDHNVQARRCHDRQPSPLRLGAPTQPGHTVIGLWLMYLTVAVSAGAAVRP